MPDAKGARTFERCKINPRLAREGEHEKLQRFYRELISLRKGLRCFALAEREQMEIVTDANKEILRVHYKVPQLREVLVLLSFAREPRDFGQLVPAGAWQRVMDSSEPRWGGSGVASPERLPSPAAMITGRSTLVYVN